MGYGHEHFLTEQDIYLFKQGNHFRIYEKLGAHVVEVDGVWGVYFAVWAPNAERVSVIGDFNGWRWDVNPLYLRQDGTGIWDGFIPHIGHNFLYKFAIKSKFHGYAAEKKDPIGFHCEAPPKSSSIIWDLGYEWHDQEWMRTRKAKNDLHAPHSIYEVHLGSWKRKVEEGNRSLSYGELADSLVEYVQYVGYTHVEFMPVMAHPFTGSWGYQVDGYFSPASLYGNPQELMYLIDRLHQAGIGVILDWVPSHFPTDGHGLGFFDGTSLYEHADSRKGFHPDWKSHIFNYGRNEVKNFLISSALFWLDKYHADGLRVDGVASMLYLDYSRKEGEWIPNEYGGRENSEAIAFIKRFNEMVYENYPDVQTIAEESTAWAGVSRPVYAGGLGFGMKWNMGWMHDTLKYFSKDPIHRKYHHNDLTFSLLYAFHENFVLPLSHDEVVHGKGALMGKMPGDDWQKFANARLLFGYIFGHPGKKLMFMGGEFGQWAEWNHDYSIEWHLLQYQPHQNLLKWIKDLNHFYRTHPALYEKDFTWETFEWIDCNDWEGSVLTFMRKGRDSRKDILVVCNFTPVVRYNYRVGVPRGGYWKELLNSDSIIYGGSGVGNLGGVNADRTHYNGRHHSLSLTLPPLGVIFLQHEDGAHH
ncbi:MAG TPA: 1,4-alpha-glucan branching protein GlgB [Candidatus Omnitrophota bacterium]|nr:1,4-alpha-glucan branching protein GlgB [Candidatus Omnitrophota bacterium]